MPGLITLFILLFFLGAVFGSFGGVILERGQERGFSFSLKDRSYVFGGRSYCPGCNHTLQPRQLIPLIGWLIQRGKCFRCKSQIPVRYCWLEVLMGTVFVLVGWLVLGGVNASIFLLPVSFLPLIFWLFVARCLVCLVLADWLWYELNVYVRLFLLVWLIVFQAGGFIGDFSIAFWGAILLVVIFAVIYQGAKRYATRKFGEPAEGFGEGDVMLALVMGLLSSFVVERIGSIDVITGIQTVLVYLVGSCLIGLVYRALHTMVGGDREQLPFLPAMIVMRVVLLLQGKWMVGLLMGM